MTRRRLGAGRRTLVEWLAVALLSTLLLGWAVGSNLFRGADQRVYDTMLQLRQAAASEDIIIVAIDDESVAKFGRWPWPRERHAQLLDRIAAARPRAIAYDVLFTEPAPDPRSDVALAAAIARARPAIPLYMEVPGRNGAAVTMVAPLPPFAAAAGGVGHVNLSPDEDGVVRRIYLAEGDKARVWPHLAAVTACRAARKHCRAPQPATRAGLVRRAPFLIPFGGRRDHYRRVPFAALLSGSVPAAFLRDKIVLVGATATGIGDTYATPMAERDVLMPGVEVIANIIDALVEGRAIRPASDWQRLLGALVPSWLMLAGFLFLRPRENLLLGLAIGAVVVGGSALALVFGGLWLSPVAALAGLAFLYPLWGWRRLQATTTYLREELERFRDSPDDLPLARRSGDAVGTDIELLRRTIGRVRELRAFIGDTLDGLPDATLVIETGGNVRLLNAEARAVLGDEVPGQRFGVVLASLAADQSEDFATAAPADPVLPSELSDGVGRIFSLRWSPVRTADDELLCWVLRLADITELRIATRQREEALQLLTHDMRSPQASIIAALSQAGGTLDDPLAKRIEGYARRTLDLADGFVQLARADAQPLADDEIDLADMLVDATDDLWPLSAAKAITVSCHGCDDEYLVRGDRALLTRALLNLIGNAIKFSPARSRIACSLAIVDGAAQCTISDQGPGMAADKCATLFAPFQRFHPGTDGAGLGLMFVKSVVVRHGGTVRCDSEEGKGANFIVSLPLADRET